MAAINTNPETTRVCPACRAANLSLATDCWLCHGKLAATEQVIVAELVPQQTQPLSEVFFNILLAVILGLILLLGIGIGVDHHNNGMMIPYVILVGPALIAAGARYGLGYAAGSQQTAAKTLLTFAVSLAVTVSVIIVLIAAAIIALFAYCLHVITTGKF